MQLNDFTIRPGITVGNLLQIGILVFAAGGGYVLLDANNKNNAAKIERIEAQVGDLVREGRQERSIAREEIARLQQEKRTELARLQAEINRESIIMARLEARLDSVIAGQQRVEELLSRYLGLRPDRSVP